MAAALNQSVERCMRALELYGDDAAAASAWLIETEDSDDEVKKNTLGKHYVTILIKF